MVEALFLLRKAQLQVAIACLLFNKIDGKMQLLGDFLLLKIC